MFPFSESGPVNPGRQIARERSAALLGRAETARDWHLEQRQVFRLSAVSLASGRDKARADGIRHPGKAATRLSVCLEQLTW